MVTNYDIGKIPPQAIDIEEAILGALMVESGLFYQISSIIDAQSFYKESHQLIFEAIKTLDRSNSPVDLLTVTEQLRKLDNLDYVGGPFYLAKLTDKVGSGSHIEYHAKIIAQKFVQRELIRIASEIQKQAFDDSIDPSDLFSYADISLGNILNSLVDSNIGTETKEVVKSTIKEIETDCVNHAKGNLIGIPTGFKSLNNLLGGWRDGKLYIMASRPGVGKSSLALQFARVAGLHGIDVLFFSFEMRKNDLIKIYISGESGILRNKIRDGKLDSIDWTNLQRSIPNIESLPITWIDKGGLSISQIKFAVRKYIRLGKCQMVVIDYLQLITPTDKKVIREQQISEISRVLKEITLNENIPILCLSQLNREAETDQPRPSHLRESGAIEQDADVIIFPWRPGYNAQTLDGEPIPETEIKMIVAKNRDGKRGDFKIISNAEMTVFRDESESFYKPTNINDIPY